jgi:hypothetical protein
LRIKDLWEDEVDSSKLKVEWEDNGGKERKRAETWPFGSAPLETRGMQGELFEATQGKPKWCAVGQIVDILDRADG